MLAETLHMAPLSEDSQILSDLLIGGKLDEAETFMAHLHEDAGPDHARKVAQEIYEWMKATGADVPYSDDTELPPMIWQYFLEVSRCYYKMERFHASEPRNPYLTRKERHRLRKAATETAAAKALA